jgi:hypothetical protein
MTFLEINGHPLDPGFDQRDAEDFVVAIAENKVSAVSDIAAGLMKYVKLTRCSLLGFSL